MGFVVKIESSGHQFAVDAGETLLEAALRYGIGLPYGCRNGACGSCVATLLSGEVAYPDGDPEVELDNGQVVICQAHARSDLNLKVREISIDADLTIKTLPCRAEHLQRLSHDVMQVQLKLPEIERLQFLAGQYIEFILKDGRRRAFSIANAPHQDDYLELHIRHVPGGSFTGHVFDEMKDRALLRIEGPLGSFFLREDSQRPILMMAGGTGIAPLKGMIDHAQYIGLDRPMHLFWGVRALRDLYLNDEPGRWVETSSEFNYTPVLSDPEPSDQWQGKTGLVMDALLEAYPNIGDYDIYMSGPPVMIEAATPVFAQHGASLDHMYSDAFEFAKDVLDKIARDKKAEDPAQ
ncbi:2-polyprenylphenol hydroxylase and related flavodoxin oxidoreductases / CDP-6-deoxy-delta-3,4-glucoseen reductase-like [hydrothermal vent metagenome]|uniref:2-polyprenylphenol hydroxylase and related flavodoxin oxidoreductases / CDP-6-deoxy-delta-3,4-glucoseen reductase-like n=1 Tax=hydrothermal vent metagenome TaxID=652676 RepID=A0A3B0Y7T6_9ZZZZ